MTGRPLARRLTAHWKSKIALAICMNMGFWLAYFGLQRYHFSAPTLVPPVAVDCLIPFLPWTIYPYLSLTLLLPLAPWFMVSRTDLFNYTMGLGMIILTACSFFLICPTICPRPPAAASSGGLYGWVIKVDAPMNAFPSLHAALAVFTSLCCSHLLKKTRRRHVFRLALWFWTAGILIATLSTKQHVFIDLIGGCTLGAAGYGLTQALERQLVTASRPGSTEPTP